MKTQYIIGFLCVIGLLGCSGMKGRDLETTPPAVSHKTPSDDMPLLRRESAKEVWERSQRPLPPLPAKQKSAPIPQVVEDLTSAITSSGIAAATPETGMEITQNPSQEVEIPAISAKSIEGTQAISEPVEPTEPQTSVIPWGEESQTPEVQTSSTVSLNKVSPETLPETLRAYQGKVLLVNCWGIDCGPCVEELPAIEQIYREFKDRGLKVLTINSDVQRRWPEVERFVKEKGFTFDMVLKAPGADTPFHKALDPDYGADPFSVIYNREGKKICTITDALPLAEWKVVAQAVVTGKPIPITKEGVIRSYN